MNLNGLWNGLVTVEERPSQWALMTRHCHWARPLEHRRAGSAGAGGHRHQCKDAVKRAIGTDWQNQTDWLPLFAFALITYCKSECKKESELLANFAPFAAIISFFCFFVLCACIQMVSNAVSARSNQLLNTTLKELSKVQSFEKKINFNWKKEKTNKVLNGNCSN